MDRITRSSIKKTKYHMQNSIIFINQSIRYIEADEPGKDREDCDHIMAVTIKELTIDDYSAIIHIWDMAGLPTKPKGREKRDLFAREIALDHVAIYGLYENDQILGVGMANWDGRRGWINRLAIHPDHRGHGYAALLIDACEKFLKDSGALVIAALVDDINCPSISAFQKAGMKCIGGVIYLAKYDYDGA